MLKRCVELRHFAAGLNDGIMNDWLLNALSGYKVDTQLKKLEELEKVVLKLQEIECTVRQSRAYLDTFLKLYSTLKARQAGTAGIVRSPCF